MIPIFSSLDMMQRALQVTQTAIQTTGHNISNANTDGYSRQRVNLTTWLPYPGIGINAARGAGQIGTGVNDDAIVRIRDQFVDLQVRDNSNQNGYWNSLSDAYSQMEDIINEPTDTGISSELDGFWQSLQDLAGNSGTSGTGTVVLQKGSAVADTFNYIALSLGKVQNNLNQQITENTKLVNNYADQINALNTEINKQEANGLLANDLYDERDALTDKLAQLVNIKVTKVPSGGNPSPLAEGKYTIEMVDQNGASFSPAATLVDGAALTNNHLKTDITGAGTSSPNVTVSMVKTDDTTPAGPSALTGFSGKLQGLIDAYTNDYPSVLKSLDNMASTLADKFNTVYQNTAGYDSSKGLFFLGDASGTVNAANIHVNENLTGSDVKANGLNADGTAKPSGDNSGASALSDVIAVNPYTIDGATSDATTLKSYLQSLIGQIGVNAQSADQFSSNSNTMLTAAQNRRSSISGVSLDEELTNLIQLQHSYGAAAKVVTTLDTLLDTLINKMG
ncbi:flagellar hook-associated protein FlgK [Sporolactobacillus laevolacticus]|uniref:Flagellar hook-associated protein 1 n=1 Tax=Sporolactobacillus laevolacticus DSM 442 TaxID=1395513 RepID=V6IVZ2_9BACL|nr:flagellar hook-associated protein FlgK [Sporolactobacillus laevolacticus]EST10666.1 flagellar hook protein FlgK [Sporolactobacillus laevolacticus DSM 442]